jgi:hypothetical protein
VTAGARLFEPPLASAPIAAEVVPAKIQLPIIVTLILYPFIEI